MEQTKEKRRRTSKGLLVASTNLKKQSIIVSTVEHLKSAYKEYGIMTPLLLTFMKIYELNH